MKRSAEFWRGADWQWVHGARRVAIAEALADAEAREAFPIPDTLPEVSTGGVRMSGNTTDQPTAAEVIAAAEKAIETGVCYLRIYRNEHKHLNSWLGSEDENTLLTDEEELARALALIARYNKANHGK